MPLSAFPRDKHSKDGHKARCKPCERAAQRANRLAKIDQYRKSERARARRKVGYYREYRKRNRARVRQWKREWEERNPEKALAHRIVRGAIRNGSLQKEPCAECGTVSGVQAHHEDYSKPLTVVWLCPVHHGRLQRKSKP